MVSIELQEAPPTLRYPVLPEYRDLIACVDEVDMYKREPILELYRSIVFLGGRDVNEHMRSWT